MNKFIEGRWSPPGIAPRNKTSRKWIEIYQRGDGHYDPIDNNIILGILPRNKDEFEETLKTLKHELAHWAQHRPITEEERNRCLDFSVPIMYAVRGPAVLITLRENHARFVEEC